VQFLDSELRNLGNNNDVHITYTWHLLSLPKGDPTKNDIKSSYSI
jgi:hypothetical protein